MMSIAYCPEDRAVERAEEECRWCKDIVMLLGRVYHHEIPTTSVDVALIASFIEYFRYVYLGATNGWIQLQPGMITQGKLHSYGPPQFRPLPRSEHPIRIWDVLGAEPQEGCGDFHNTFSPRCY